eukprot:gb/GEZN01005372.1/.p1 GENE.gb/GEZN01005372.1/~~gb/GEZN01005372.1/.p1  ORF type:complete len:538 (-),score=82.61 gb/GEZN01005372.1/:143-1756(-)
MATMNPKGPEGPLPAASQSFPDFSSWTEEEVASAVGGLGASKAWKRYAALCVEEELDGQTMTAITVDILIKDYHFKKPHAQVVVNYFQPKASSPQPKPPVMGLTEKEMKLMEPLVGQAERCRESCKRLEKVLVSLGTQKEEELARVDQWFRRAHEVLTQSHASTTDGIKKDLDQVHALLAQHLVDTHKAQQDIEDSERQCLSFPAQTLSDIKERTTNITSLVDTCLAIGIPSLENDVRLSVSFAPEILPFFATKNPTAVAVVSLPQPKIYLDRGLTSAEHTTAMGTGLERVCPSEEAKFIITTKDHKGQVRNAGGDSFVVESAQTELKSSVVDKNNGTYDVSYVLGKESKENTFPLSVSLRGRPICGSPFAVSVGFAQWAKENLKWAQDSQTVALDSPLIARCTGQSCKGGQVRCATPLPTGQTTRWIVTLSQTCSCQFVGVIPDDGAGLTKWLCACGSAQAKSYGLDGSGAVFKDGVKFKDMARRPEVALTADLAAWTLQLQCGLVSEVVNLRPNVNYYAACMIFSVGVTATISFP